MTALAERMTIVLNIFAGDLVLGTLGMNVLVCLKYSRIVISQATSGCQRLIVPVISFMVHLLPSLLVGQLSFCVAYWLYIKLPEG